MNPAAGALPSRTRSHDGCSATSADLNSKCRCVRHLRAGFGRQRPLRDLRIRCRRIAVTCCVRGRWSIGHTDPRRRCQVERDRQLGRPPSLPSRHRPLFESPVADSRNSVHVPVEIVVSNELRQRHRGSRSARVGRTGDAGDRFPLVITVSTTAKWDLVQRPRTGGRAPRRGR